MRKVLALLLLVFTISCSDKPEISKAREAVEALIQKIDQEDYQAASEYYTADFNAGESSEERIAKFKQMKGAFGNVQSLELTGSKEEANFAEPAKIVLTYHVKHTGLNSIETFVVVKEDGKHKVSRHDVKGDNQ